MKKVDDNLKKVTFITKGMNVDWINISVLNYFFVWFSWCIFSIFDFFLSIFVLRFSIFKGSRIFDYNISFSRYILDVYICFISGFLRFVLCTSPFRFSYFWRSIIFVRCTFIIFFISLIFGFLEPNSVYFEIIVLYNFTLVVDYLAYNLLSCVK